MAYEKKYKTAAELSAARAEAGRRGAAALKKSGNFRGGRKPGIRLGIEQTTSCTIRETDSDYITRMSFALGISKAASIRVLVLAYRRHCATFQARQETDARLDASMEEFGKFTTAKNAGGNA